MTSVARGLPGRSYTDADLLRHELDHVFATTWQLVGHTSQLTEHGDYLTATVGDQGVAVTRVGDRLHAMFNVCQHRGHELLVAELGHTTTITCPYHAWTYDLDGTLLHARGEGVGPLCVPPVRVESLAGFLFVNIDDAAPSLEEYVPGIADELLALAPDAPERVLTHRHTEVIEANWKIAVENYNECYHCPNVHKAFTAGVVSPGSYRVTPRGNCLHHTAEPSEQSGYSRETDGDYGSFYVWPASSIQCYPGQVLNTFRWIPLAVDRTQLVREWWFDSGTPTAAQQEVIDLDWNTTVAEDLDLMASVQRGMASRGYRPGPLVLDPSGVADTNAENPVAHLHGLLLAAASPTLAAGSQTLAAGSQTARAADPFPPIGDDVADLP